MRFFTLIYFHEFPLLRESTVMHRMFLEAQEELCDAQGGGTVHAGHRSGPAAQKPLGDFPCPQSDFNTLNTLPRLLV